MESQSKLSFKESKKPTLSQQVDLLCGTPIMFAEQAQSTEAANTSTVIANKKALYGYRALNGW